MNPFIKQLDNRTYDVFYGNGFHNWTRFKKFHYGLKPVAGKHVDRQQINQINSLLAN